MTINKPQLTISLLASDRPDTLRRCLDSLCPITEALSCELILIDTSKNPVVHEMLLEYSDLVYEFEWCKDFAKARNEGLKRAKGEWFLFLDDDEWFVETDALIDFFQSGEYKQYGYANYQVRNFLDAKYENYTDAWVSRMIRVEEDTRFVSKIHEYFYPLRGKLKNLPAMVYHSGYIYETPEAEQAHFERNCTLLLEMIEEEPDSLRWPTQLAQEYCGKGEWEFLVELCKKNLKRVSKIDEVHINRHIGTFYVGLVIGLLNQKKYHESLQICHEALEDKRSTELLKAYMYLKSGEAYFRLGQWDDAYNRIKKYFWILEKTDQESAEIQEQMFVLLVSDAFNENSKKIAHSILICSHLEKGSTKALQEYYDKLGWAQAIIFGFEDIEKYFVKAMWTFDYEPIFAQIIVDAFKNRNLRELFCKAILAQTKESADALKGQDEQVSLQFRDMLSFLAEAIQAVIAGPQTSDMLGYYNALQYYVQATCQWYDFLQEQNAAPLLGEENPGYIQAALYISDYLELETQDTVKALGALKAAVEVLPDFASGIGSFLHFYTELDRQRAEKQKKEMDALRVQVMGQVKAMIESGQTEAAARIITQLKQMFPEDLEVAALALEVRIHM